MKKLLYVLIMGFISYSSYAQATTAVSKAKNIKPKIFSIVTYKASANLVFGKLQMGKKEKISQTIFNNNEKISEMVLYKNDKPVDYYNYSYDVKGNNYRTINKNWNEEKTLNISFDDKNSPKQEIQTDKDGNVLSTALYEIENDGKTRTVLKITKDNDKNATGGVAKIYEDGKLVQEYYYNETGNVKAANKIVFNGKIKITTQYDQESKAQSITNETYNEKNEIQELQIEWQDKLSFMGATRYIYKYKYDNNNNWIEKIEYKVEKKYGVDYYTPIEIEYQEISYEKDAVVSIKPVELFRPQSENENIKENNKVFVNESIDKIDDSKALTFVIDAEKGKGVYGDRINIVIRGKIGQAPEFYINWNSYLGSEAYVTLRLGTEEAETKQWSLSTDSKATFYPSDIYELTKRLSANKTLIVKITPYNESPIIAEFDISELAELFKKYELYFMKSIEK